MTAQNPRDMRDYMRTLERLSKQQQAVPAMIANTVKEVEEKEQETKARRPAPPIELEAQTGFYRDPATNRQRVRLSMDFPDVIFNTDGTKALIKQYELWGREETESTEEDDLLPEDERPWEQQATNTESFFRVHEYVPGRKWRFRVRALGIESVQPGEWSEELVVTMLRDTTPPPQPSAPIAEATRGQIIVTWDGKAVSGNMPADFSYTILAHGTESSPTKEVARFGPEGGFTVISGAAYNKPQHFRLRAVDESGNLGPWSEQATAITTPLVDVDIILSEIDAAKTQIKNAEKLIIESGVELGQKLKQNDEQIAATEQKLTGPGGLTDRIEDAESLLDDAGSLMLETGRTLRQKLNETDVELEAARKRLTITEGDVSSAASQIAAAEKLIASNNTALTGKLTTANTAIAAAQAQVDTLKNTTVPKLNTDLTAATTRLTTAEGKITTAQTDLTTAKADIVAAKKSITDNKTVMDGAVVRLTITEEEVTAAKGRLTTAEGKLTTLQNTTIPALNTSLTSATTRLTTAEGKVTAAEGKLTTAQSDLTKLTGRVSPLETGLTTLNNTTIPALNLSINGKTTIQRSTSIASLPANYSLGDRWEKWSSLAAGGKLQQTWRHNGSAWIEEILDASYLPLVDIGTGTFGSLSGGRLTAKSVSANSLLIGVGENLLADPSFEDQTISERRASSNANWSWVQDALTGSYMTATADSGDMQLGNSSNAEMFPIDPRGALAFTAEFEGPDLQVYLQVKYADGSANTGPYLKTLTSSTAGTGRRTATVQWDFAGPILSSSGAPPVSARPILRARPGGVQKVYSVRLAPATKGELIVNGTITGDHVAAESVAAKVGQFIQIDVSQLNVTDTANIRTVVAQKLAAATAEFQTVDAKNLFVSGTSSLNEVVARRLAAETGVFISLTTDQLTAGSANINNLVAQKIAAGTAAFQKADISNLTAGTANMTQAVIDKLVANTAKFQTVTVDNITATATANLNSVVAQRIAAGTASFQTVDVKNLFVTGTASMTEVVAKRIASEAGTFITLNVDQLDVSGNANFKTAVADKLFVNMFATNKLTTNELLVGKGENMIPWFPNQADAAKRTWAPHIGLGGTELKIEGNGGRSGGPHALLNAMQIVSGTRDYVLQFSPGGKAKNGLANYFDVEPNTRYKVSVWVRSGGSYASGGPNVYLHAQTTTGAAVYESGSATISAIHKLTGTWTEITHEFTTMANSSAVILRMGMDQPGHIRVEDPLMVRDAASLIATGGIVSDHITASESMSAKIGQFLKLDVGQLVVTGNSSFNEVVANKMFTNIFATNRLTASQVLIGEGGNILPDPNFLDKDGWSGDKSWFVTNGGRNSNNAVVIPAGVAAQQGTYYGSNDRNRQFAVIPGASYKLSVWVKPDATVPLKGIGIYLKWTTPNGAAAGSFATPGPVTNDKETLKAGVWTEVTGVATVGDTAVKGFIGLFTQTNTTTRVIFSEPSAVQAVDQGLIVDNGILARHITASEEMSAKIGSFLQLDVGNLTATGTSNMKTAVIDNLWTNVVRSRSITTDMLLVGKGANLIPNGDLANGKEGWNANFGLYSPDPNAVKLGYKASIWLEGTQTWSSSAPFPVKAGTKYKFSMYARANVTGKRFYVQLATSEAEADNIYLIQNQLTYTANTLYEAEFEAPTGATQATLRIYANHANGTTTAGHQWFTGFEMYEMNAASLIVNGGIVTKQLKVTEDMTVALLKVHKVEAGEINVNTLAADNVFTGLLNAKLVTSDMFSGKLFSGGTFTGSVFRTHTAANTGVQLDSVGLRAWNTAKIQTFVLNASTGDISIQNGTFTGGTFQTTSSANRGIKLTSTSLAAYSSKGVLTFLLDAAEGDAMFDSRVAFGSKTTPRWVIVPWESTTSERAGIWLVNPTSTGVENGIGGTNTAGMFMDNSNATFANVMHVRGSNGGGVKAWGRFQSDDMYSGTIHHSGGLYHLQGGNGSYFQSQVIFNGRIQYGGAPSTTSGANAHIASADGTIWKSSSASRFKIDPRPMYLDEALLDVPVEDWIDRAQFEHQRELLAMAQPRTEADERALSLVNLDRVPGSIAEKVEAAGGKAFVTYDRDGLIEGLSYDRFALARTAILKTQLDRAVARIEALEGMMA